MTRILPLESEKGILTLILWWFPNMMDPKFLKTIIHNILGPSQSQVGREFNGGGSYVLCDPWLRYHKSAGGGFIAINEEDLINKRKRDLNMTIGGEFAKCDINVEFAISQSSGEELYCGRCKTLWYAISQSQKEKGDERICIAKENGTIEIKFCGSQPFKRPSVFFMNVFKIFKRGMGKHD